MNEPENLQDLLAEISFQFICHNPYDLRKKCDIPLKDKKYEINFQAAWYNDICTVAMLLAV